MYSNDGIEYVCCIYLWPFRAITDKCQAKQGNSQHDRMLFSPLGRQNLKRKLLTIHGSITCLIPNFGFIREKVEVKVGFYLYYFIYTANLLHSCF